MRAESFGYNLDDVAFDWTARDQVDLAANLTLPQFSLMGHRYTTCTKVSFSIFEEKNTILWKYNTKVEVKDSSYWRFEIRN